MRYIGRRLLQLIPVLLIVSFLSFLLLNLLPGDPTIRILGFSASESATKQLRHDLELDKPIQVRYAHWLGDSVQGDLGKSYLNKQPVFEAIKQRLPVTLELLVLSELLAIVLAVPAAIYASQKPDGWFDRLSTTASFGLLSVPNFMLALLLVFIFAVKLHWLPAEGFTHFTDDPVQNLRQMVLPTVTLAMAEIAAYLRLLRADMIATLQEDFILMARAEGLPRWRILLRHAFRPSTFSLITVAGLNIGRLIGGTFIVEVIFSLPGIGLLGINAINSRDYLMVQGVVLVVSVGYVLVNFAVDILYTFIDPRVRHVRAAA